LQVAPFLSNTVHLFHSFPGEIGGFQREESQDIIRDIDWATRNVMLGYDVAGSTLKILILLGSGKLYVLKVMIKGPNRRIVTLGIRGEKEVESMNCLCSF